MSLITHLARIQFAAGAIGPLGQELAQLGVSRPMIVTDKGIVKAGLLEATVAAAGLKRKIPVSVADYETLLRQSLAGEP